MQPTTNLLNYSVVTLYLMNNMWYLAVAGLLSYNIPQLFKQKYEAGYMLRAGFLVVMSLAILPVTMFLPENYSMGDKLLVWFLFFSVGLVIATYGTRKFNAKFGLFFSRFTVKHSIRRGAQTDIRAMDKELPKIANYNPLKFIDLKKGIFIGLDEMIKPIYLKLVDWFKRHILIVGGTRTGKGVIMQILGIQSLMLGERLIVLDPKGDQFMPQIFKEQCDKLNLPYTYIDLTKDVAQINLIADFNARDLKNCLVESFSQREMGSESDVYRKREQEFLGNLADFIVENGSVDNGSGKSLSQLCKDYDIGRYADKYQSSVSDLNKLVKVSAINANVNSISELMDKGGCIYIAGDLLDETMKKIQRFIFCRVVQLARNYSNTGNDRNITVFADELVAHISRFVAESYTVSLGWGLKIVSAIQDLKLLRGAPADLDPEFLKGAVFGNSQNKLFYRTDDIETADFLSDMTGKIIVEEEQKQVTRNNLNAEQLARETRLIQSNRNYFDRNMILNLKQFEAVFCASLSYRSTIACLCKTSPVQAADGINARDVIKAKTQTFNISIINQNNINNGENHANTGEYNSHTTDRTIGASGEKVSTSQSDHLF